MGIRPKKPLKTVFDTFKVLDVGWFLHHLEKEVTILKEDFSFENDVLFGLGIC